jgi:hypothetical protein
MAGIESTTEKDTIAYQITTTNGWTKLDGATENTKTTEDVVIDETTGKTITTTSTTTIYYKKCTSDADKDTDLAVFKNFSIDGDTDNDTLSAYNNAKITVKAYAIQQDGFNSSEKTPLQNAAAAWAAVRDAANDSASTNTNTNDNTNTNANTNTEEPKGTEGGEVTPAPAAGENN